MGLFPKGIRLATDEEAKDPILFGPPDGPVISGAPAVTGRSFKCPTCGAVIVRSIQARHRVELNLKCSNCGALCRLIY